jgi:hypothetical protein
MSTCIFTEAAKDDILEQTLFYEAIQEGLGFRFSDEVYNAADEISIFPKAYLSYIKSVHERRLKKFPFKLIYTIEDEIIFVHAVYPSKAETSGRYKRII